MNDSDSAPSAVPAPALYTAELKGHLRLSKDGDWYHDGKIFERKALSDLFHRSIVWDENDKEYFIRIGRERARFEIEDVPYFVSAITLTAPMQIKLLGGHEETLNPKKFSVGIESQIYYELLSGHRARLTRAAHQLLLQHAVSDSEIIINGTSITLNPRPE
jgi:hypothetical protein